MLPRRSFPLIALLVTTLLFSACSRQTLYENAISWERSAAGLQASTISVDNMTIAYLSNEEPVNGETIVLIHGFGANKDNWTRLAGELTDEFNVYAIDLPGHGDSSKSLDLGYRFEDQVGHLSEILAALNIDEAHMMGNSMGGAITALYAATYPDQIRSAVLFDPAGILEYDSKLVELVMEGDNPLIPAKEGDFERLIDFALERKPFVPWPIYEVMEEKAIANREVNQAIFEAIRDSVYEQDFREAITRIEAPVLVIWGKEDRVINYRNADVFVNRIPDARKVLLDGVGHAPMVEVPEKSAELFREFLAETR
ncbi:alpha/beta hydrolase [Marinobacter vulgaris]|uniref:Alpha/beta hydrolase n=1 Tax=Marinobacter vulgaris TaxID=1928331 RepID=A0A2V3ZNU7_9GAMM|nr:alpha/beta hydrolase [Marinobacter vulgaris]PXX93481.1 alpha/beta hydrolase [Marinobacter vulgaris]TSJ72505.1 alpha/beta hydrolase [Marinobacter vulgaris]